MTAHPKSRSGPLPPKKAEVSVRSEEIGGPVVDQGPGGRNEISSHTNAALSFRVYDDFDTPDYSLTNYAERWLMPNGSGEMVVNDTRHFSGGHFRRHSPLGLS
jgi:hypothetical protein